MKLKAFLAGIAAIAVVVGLALPIPHKSEAHDRAQSQFATFEVGHG